MVIILAVFYFLNGLIYFISILGLITQKRQIQNNNKYYPYVSVIVPARNEEGVIKKNLDCILKQNYPIEKFEIIAVNDCSSDGTKKIINSMTKNNSQIHLIDILYENRKGQGKLNAIDIGIQNAKGEIIITTDADVWMGPNWIEYMVKEFDRKTGLIIGITLDEISINPVHAFQSLDGAGIRIIAAGLARLNHPITCQGSNLAFRKKAYNEVRENVLSLASQYGNREWLMQEVEINTEWIIKTQIHPDSIASTKSPDRWNELINQRARWASTGKNYSKLSIRLYLAIIYFSFVSFFLGFVFLPIDIISIIWLMKLIIDFSVAVAVVKSINRFKLLYAFPIVFVLQPIMIIITAFLGTFNLYRWK